MPGQKDRRAFHKTIGLLAAGSLGLASLPTATAQPEEGSPRAVASAALMDILRSRFGKFLSEDQLKRVRQKVLANLSIAESMRRVPLRHSDEPAFVFRADLP
jgi:hypothetical protein